MHCVAGDGVGILAGAVLAHVFGLTGLREVALEYALGFAFGWMVFQALFMRDMSGGSYPRSIARTFIPELLSMNLLMAGMVPTMMILQMQLERGADPTTAAFWFVMPSDAGLEERLLHSAARSRLPQDRSTGSERPGFSSLK